MSTSNGLHAFGSPRDTPLREAYSPAAGPSGHSGVSSPLDSPRAGSPEQVARRSVHRRVSLDAHAAAEAAASLALVLASIAPAKVAHLTAAELAQARALLHIVQKAFQHLMLLFSQLFTRLADLLKRGAVGDATTHAALSAIATLFRNASTRVGACREALEALLRGLTTVVSKLEGASLSASRCPQGAALVADAADALLSCTPAREQLLACVPPEELCQLLRGLLPMLEPMSGDDTVRGAARCVLSLCVDDAGCVRSRVVGSLREGALRSLVSRLARLVAHADPPAAAAARAALLPLLLDEGVRVRSMGALRDGDIAPLVGALCSLLSPAGSSPSTAAACLRAVLAGCDGRRRVACHLSTQQLCACFCACADLLAAADEALCAPALGSLAHLLEEAGPRERCVSDCAPGALAPCLASCVPLLSSLDDDVASAAALLVSRLVCHPRGLGAVAAFTAPPDPSDARASPHPNTLAPAHFDDPCDERTPPHPNTLAPALLSSLAPLLSARHEEFEHGSAFAAAAACHALLSHDSVREVCAAAATNPAPPLLLPRLLRGLVPALCSAHVDTAWAAAGALCCVVGGCGEQPPSPPPPHAWGAAAVVACPLPTLRALVMSLTPLLGSPHAPTCSGAFCCVCALCAAPGGAARVLASLRDDALAALVRGVTPLCGAVVDPPPPPVVQAEHDGAVPDGAAHSLATPASGASMLRSLLEDPAGKRRVVAALCEADATALLERLIDVLDAAQRGCPHARDAAACVRCVLGEPAGAATACRLGDAPFAALLSSLIALLDPTPTDGPAPDGFEAVAAAAVARGAAQSLCSLLHHPSCVSRALQFLHPPLLSSLVAHLAPLIGAGGGAVVSCAAACGVAASLADGGSSSLLSLHPTQLGALASSLASALASPDADVCRASSCCLRELLEPGGGASVVLDALPPGGEAPLVANLVALLRCPDGATRLCCVVCLNSLLDDDGGGGCGRPRVLACLPPGALDAVAAGVAPLLRSPVEEVACGGADALFKLLTLAEGRSALSDARPALLTSLLDGLACLMDGGAEASQYAAAGAVFNFLTEKEGRAAILALPRHTLASLVSSLAPLLSCDDGDTAYAAAGAVVRLQLDPAGRALLRSLPPHTLADLACRLAARCGDGGEPTQRAALEALRRLAGGARGAESVTAALSHHPPSLSLVNAAFSALLRVPEHAAVAATSLAWLLGGATGAPPALAQPEWDHLLCGLVPLVSPACAGGDDGASAASIRCLDAILSLPAGVERAVSLPPHAVVDLLRGCVWLLGDESIGFVEAESDGDSPATPGSAYALSCVASLASHAPGGVVALGCSLPDGEGGFPTLLSRLIPLLGSPQPGPCRSAAFVFAALLAHERARERVAAQPEACLRPLTRWLTLLLCSPDGDTSAASAQALCFLLLDGGYSRLLGMGADAVEALVAKLHAAIHADDDGSGGGGAAPCAAVCALCAGVLLLHHGRARTMRPPPDMLPSLVSRLTSALAAPHDGAAGDDDASPAAPAEASLHALLCTSFSVDAVLRLPPRCVVALGDALGRRVADSDVSLACLLRLLSPHNGAPLLLQHAPMCDACDMVRALAAAGAALRRPEGGDDGVPGGAATAAASSSLLFLVIHHFPSRFEGDAPAGGFGPHLARGAASLCGADELHSSRALLTNCPPDAARRVIGAIVTELREAWREGGGEGGHGRPFGTACSALLTLLSLRTELWPWACRALRDTLPAAQRADVAAEVSRLWVERSLPPGAERPVPLLLFPCPGRPLASHAVDAVLSAHPASLRAGLLVCAPPQPPHAQGGADDGACDDDGAPASACGVLADEIAGTSSGLFRRVARVEGWMHPRSGCAPQHLPLYTLLGRLVGLALSTRSRLPVCLSPLFYKQLFEQRFDAQTLCLDDVRCVDPPAHAFLSEMAGAPLNPSGCGLCFTDSSAEAGETVHAPLLPGGDHLLVTDANKDAFVALKAAARILRATHGGIRDALRRGATELLHPSCLSPDLFDAAELQQLVEG